MHKYFTQILIVLCLTFLLSAFNAFAYTSPGQPNGFVNDYTNTFNVEQKQALENKLSTFSQTTGNEIAVVLINSLADDTVENFANQLFADWGIGKKGADNGILVLVAKDDRQMRIEVGYGLEGSLTDAQSYWIINDIMKPAFQQNDFYSGIDQATDKIIAATQGEVLPESNPNPAANFDIGNLFWMILFIPIWLASILGRSKSWWAGGVLGGIGGVIIGFFQGFLYFGIISIAILIPLGLLFDYIVSKKYHAAKAVGIIPWWIGGGRGGHGGGGFGGFGGGMSGGGGSSGSW
jgi:uncharacterized protein